MHFAMRWNRLFHSSASWTLDMHLRPPQTGSPLIVFSLLGIGRSRIERGLASTVSAAAAAPRYQWGQPLLLLCAHWHCHDEEKGHGVPSRAALAPNFDDLRETMMHVPVCSDCPSVLKRKGGDLARFSEETGNHFLLRNSQTADCISVSGPYRRIQVSSSVSTSQVNF